MSKFLTCRFLDLLLIKDLLFNAVAFLCDLHRGSFLLYEGLIAGDGRSRLLSPGGARHPDQQGGRLHQFTGGAECVTGITADPAIAVQGQQQTSRQGKTRIEDPTERGHGPADPQQEQDCSRGMHCGRAKWTGRSVGPRCYPWVCVAGADHRSSWTTFPATSVSRKSRP